jgi:nucleoside-diphosphate-sugar epimerase
MSSSKRVIVIGGTGFLGYHAIQEFLTKGWDVTALGLPPSPHADSSAITSSQTIYPPTVKVVFRNLDETSDGDLLALLDGHNALVFAAGVDDRITPKKPAYPFFHHANVEVCVRVLKLAKQAGIKRAVVLGSYFAHFNHLWPELRLAERHPYIRSRVEQEKAVTTVPGLDVDVLELPYIFGGMPVLGWKSLWTPLVKYIRSTRTVFYMQGGSACITANTVGQAVVGALEHGQAGKCYPIGDENLTWSEMLSRLAAADGRQIRVVNLPIWLIKIGLYGLWFIQQLVGRQAGLDPHYFASLQTAETFLDPRPSQVELKYKIGGLDRAFQETVLSSQ